MMKLSNTFTAYGDPASKATWLLELVMNTNGAKLLKMPSAQKYLFNSFYFLSYCIICIFCYIIYQYYKNCFSCIRFTKLKVS